MVAKLEHTIMNPKPDASSSYQRARQPLHAQALGHNLTSIGSDNCTLYVRHNCLCWNVFTNTTAVRGFSLDNPDISAWLGSSLCLLYKRLTQQEGVICILWYCGNLRWCIAEQGPRDWDWARATWHRTWPVLNCYATTVTGENFRRQNSRCNKNQWSWRGCFWRSTSRRTLS